MPAFPNGLTPAKEQLTAKRGFTSKQKITLFEDEAKTKRFKLEGLTIRLVIAGYLTLKSGEGLTITAGQGEIQVVLTPEQTKNAPGEQLHYYVELEESATEIECPLEGAFIFRNP